MPALADQQPTSILWLVAVVFCQRDYKQAQTLVQGGHILLNGQAVQDLLQMVNSGDGLAWQNQHRTVDLDVRRQGECPPPPHRRVFWRAGSHPSAVEFRDVASR